MRDPILTAFLQAQFAEGVALAGSSDLLELLPLGMEEGPADRYVAMFHAKGLVRQATGEIVEASDFAVGIHFHEDFLHTADPPRLLTWIGPPNVWHANIRPPFICVGRVSPGASLSWLLHQIHRVITYNKKTLREDDALNPAACQWARLNLHRFPVDTRPLRRRSIDLSVEAVAAPGDRQ